MAEYGLDLAWMWTRRNVFWEQTCLVYRITSDGMHPLQDRGRWSYIILNHVHRSLWSMIVYVEYLQTGCATCSSDTAPAVWTDQLGGQWVVCCLDESAWNTLPTKQRSISCLAQSSSATETRIDTAASDQQLVPSFYWRTIIHTVHRSQAAVICFL